MATPFYKVQAGKESTAGTAVAATAKWLFGLRPKIGDYVWEQPEEETGSLAAALRAYQTEQQADLGDLEGDATFETLMYPLAMAIKGGVTPTQPDATGSPTVYLWTYAPDLTSANDPDTFTVEWGDDVQAWETPYVFATKLEIEGKMGKAWQVKAGLVGRGHSTTSFTGSLSTPSVESIIMNKSKLYMDDAGGTIGSTQISGAFVAFKWEMPKHFVPYFTADGELYFTTHSEEKIAPKATLTLVVDSTTKALLTTKYTAGTVQLVRIEGNGTAIDATYNRYARVDGAFLIKDVKELADDNGKTVVDIELAGQYDDTWGKLFEITVQNNVSTLP